MTEHRGLVQDVRDQARLGSAREAEDLIRAVTGAMADRLPPEAWELLETAVPRHLRGEKSTTQQRRQGREDSVNDLFEDVGARRELGPPTAARYVRVVAEALRRALTDAELRRLDRDLPDEYLALFEVRHRGELTEPEGFTPGADRADPGEQTGQ